MGTITYWRRHLAELHIHSVYAIYTDGQLAGIELDGAFQKIDPHHPSPVEHALRECSNRLKVERETPPI